MRSRVRSTPVFRTGIESSRPPRETRLFEGGFRALKTALLIIDPQNDFCDPASGALYVPGADGDMLRLAELLRRNGHVFEEIHVTLDSHHLRDIAHPLFWENEHGANPTPFTQIRAPEIEGGLWRTSDSRHQARASSYVHSLEFDGKRLLTIWPPHCLIGSVGQAVYSPLFEALLNWERQFGTANFVAKGENPFTEHYSAIRAEVPDPEDLSTQTNSNLIAALKLADRIVVAGEAGSHCVANTLYDLAEALTPEEVAKITLLTDAISPVPGLEALQATMIEKLTLRGMKKGTTSEF